MHGCEIKRRVSLAAPALKGSKLNVGFQRVDAQSWPLGGETCRKSSVEPSLRRLSLSVHLKSAFQSVTQVAFADSTGTPGIPNQSCEKLREWCKQAGQCN